MTSPGSPEARGLPGVAMGRRFYRSAVALCEDDAISTLGFPSGEEYVYRVHRGYRSQARETPGYSWENHSVVWDASGPQRLIVPQDSIV